MVQFPEDTLQKLREYGQQHVVQFWEELKPEQRISLLEQIQAINLGQLRDLHAQREKIWPIPESHHIQPALAVRLHPGDEETKKLGEKAMQQGEVAILVVAGGQGSRLGLDIPKGMFEIGPVSGKTLFQVHAEKVLGLRRKYQTHIPFLIMTSPATDLPTRDFFREQSNFGLPAEDVIFFRQGTMPAVDWHTGKLLLEAKDRLFTAPNGHGGVLLALHQSGILHRLRSRKIRHLVYFQVDNPLVKVADPLFLGHHIKNQAEISSKVLVKQHPREKLGNLVVVDGRCQIIEYSDLPDELSHRRDPDGQLQFRIGSPAIHIFDVDFLLRVHDTVGDLPFHVARKTVPYLDETGQKIDPPSPNAVKFEMFIFDLLPLAEKWTVVETTHEEEFAPLKNSQGPDSPETVRRAISRQAIRWLGEAGAEIAAEREGDIILEISPLFALDLEELKKRIKPGTPIPDKTYLHNEVSN